MTQVPKLMELDSLIIAVTLMKEVWCDISQSTSDLLNNVEHRTYKETQEFCAYRQDLYKIDQIVSAWYGHCCT